MSTVTQADRDAAAAFYPEGSNIRAEMLSGKLDHFGTIQALAKIAANICDTAISNARSNSMVSGRVS